MPYFPRVGGGIVVVLLVLLVLGIVGDDDGQLVRDVFVATFGIYSSFTGINGDGKRSTTEQFPFHVVHRTVGGGGGGGRTRGRTRGRGGVGGDLRLNGIGGVERGLGHGRR